VDFRAAGESELVLIWRALKGKGIFHNFAELGSFYKENPARIQVSADSLSCLGVAGSWYSGSNSGIGAIKALVAPDRDRKQFIKRMANVVRAEGFATIVSPLLQRNELGSYLESGFEEGEKITLLRKTLETSPVRNQFSATSSEIREFDSSFLPYLIEIEEKAFSKFWRLGQDELLSFINAGSCFAVFSKGALIGYNITTVTGEIGTIVRLAVLPDFQGRGFGSQLLSHIPSRLREKNVRSVLVSTQVGNRNALSLYRKFGFKPLGEDRYVLVLES